MHPDRRKNDYRTYNYIPPSVSRLVQKSRYQSNDSQRGYHPSTTHTSSRTEQQYPPSTAISNLAEPLSVFDDLKPSVNRRVNVAPFPLAYIPPNPIRRSSVRDARLATASAMRERLLTDIQSNISEIDREITFFEPRQYIPPRISSIPKQIHSPSNGNHLWIKKERKIYEVVPRIASEVKKPSRPPTAQLTEHHTDSPIFIGQYHYGPEIEEVQISATDPENSDRKSVLDELSDFDSPETFSLSEFRHEQSVLPQNRALIFVPECGDYNDDRFNELTEDLHENDSKDTQIARSLTTSPLHEFPSPDKLSIEDFQSLIQTAPEPKIQVSSVPPVNETQLNLTNTMLSKPVRHSRLSTRVQETIPSAQQTSTPAENDIAYFFSDFGNEGEEDRISIDFYPFTLPTASELIPDDNTSNTVIRQSQISLLNPHALQQPLNTETNNEYLKEAERKNVGGATAAATGHTASSSTSKSPSKKMLPISVEKNRQTEFARNNKNNTQDQRQTPLTSSPINTVEKSRENNLNNFSVRLQPSPSISDQKKATDQRSSGRSNKHQSKKGIEHVSDKKQQTSVGPQSDSSLPVPLTPPELDDIRPSTSRTATPERRNSIPSLDENILLTATNIMNFDDWLVEQPNTERLEPSPLVNSTSLQDLQSDEVKLNAALPSDQKENEPVRQNLTLETDRIKSISPFDITTTKSEHDDLCLPSLSPRQSDISDANLTSVSQEDTFRQPISPDHDLNQIEDPKLTIEKNHIPLEKESPLVTASQQRSKLSLLTHPSSPKERTFVTDQGFQTNVDDEKAVARHKTKQDHRSSKAWRERIDTVLANRHFSTNKYSHVKSRVDSFANFEYQPRRILILPKEQLTHTKENKLMKRITQFHPQILSGPTPQIFGRLWCLPDGSTRIFHESLVWKGEPKIKSRSLGNFRYKPRRNDLKIFNEKPRWHSESRISELLKESPHRPQLIQTVSLLSIADVDDARLHQQTISKLEESSLEIMPKDSKRLHGKLAWEEKSKLKDSIWQNVNYQPKRSQVQIFHQPVHWNNQSKLRLTYSSNSDIQAKVKYFSTMDPPPARKRRGLFAQSYDPQWKDIQSSLPQEVKSIDQTNEEVIPLLCI